jgi:probable addiction module antidote protein
MVEVRKTELFQRGSTRAGGSASAKKMKKTTKTTKYDVAEHLRTTKEMSAYLEASLAEADGDPALIAKALGDIARARGMTEIARHSGLSRESLYKALSGDRVPDFGTILRVVKALGLELHVSPAR